MGALALWNSVRARQAERDHPPSGKFVEVDGVRLHYLESGEGTAVVLLHGNLVTAEDWVLSGVFGLLAAQHRVLAFDRPGYGYSERRRGAASPAAQAELLHGAFRHLGIERPILVGHSFGAVVALALALAHPETVRGLVLLGGYYHPTIRADVLLALPPAVPVLGPILSHTVSPLYGRALLPLLIKGMFAPLAVPPRFTQEFRTGFPLRPSQLRAEAQDGVMMAPAVAAMAGRYAELLMPVEILAGASDRAVDVGRHSRALHHEIGQSRLRIVPDAGHMVHYAAPAAIVDAVEAIGDGNRRNGAGRTDS